LKPIVNKNFNVEWDSKGQMKTDTTTFTVFKKEEILPPPTPNI